MAAPAACAACSPRTLRPRLDGGTELCVSALGEEVVVVVERAVEVSPKASALGPSQLQRDPPVSLDRGPALSGGTLDRNFSFRFAWCRGFPRAAPLFLSWALLAILRFQTRADRSSPCGSSGSPVRSPLRAARTAGWSRAERAPGHARQAAGCGGDEGWQHRALSPAPNRAQKVQERYRCSPLLPCLFSHSPPARANCLSLRVTASTSAKSNYPPCLSLIGTPAFLGMVAIWLSGLGLYY